MDAPDPQGLLQAFRAELAAATDPAAVDAVVRAHTGKKSPLKAALKGLGKLPADQRKATAQALNEARQVMEAEASAAKEAAAERAIAARLDAEWQDLTLPGVAPERGLRHPVTATQDHLLDLMRRLGFSIAVGPEVEHPYYNFDALNIPEHHPARDMQDTFWVDGGLLLRSHTTTVQARVLQQKPPLPV